MKRFSNFNSILILILCLSAMCQAQSELLSFTPGARAVGLGGSGVVAVYDPSAVFWNPAALSIINQNKALLSIHEPYFLTYGAYSHFFPLYGTFGAAVAKTSTAKNAFQSAYFGWGSPISSSWHLGVSIGVLQLDQEGWSIGGIGILYRPMPTRNLKGAKGFFSTIKSLLIDNRLTLGLSAQHIPLVVTDIDHEFRFGFSYKVVPWGPQLVSAYHLHQNDDTFHFGFESTPTSNFRIYVGIEDFNNDKLAFGCTVEWENLNLDLTYSMYSERFLVSMSTRIGKNPQAVADGKVLEAKSAKKQNNLRKALRSVRLALAYDRTHTEARSLYRQIAPKIQKENKTIDSLLTVARMLENQQWFISAAAQYLNVLKIDPSNKVALYNIAMIRPKVNIHTERWFQKAVKDYERGELGRAKDVFESILIVRSDHAGSREYLDKINQFNKNEAEKHFYIGLGFYSQKKFLLAKAEFEKVLEFQSRHLEAAEYLEKIQQELKNKAKAISRLMAQATQYQKSGSYLRASRAYREVLIKDPQNNLARERLQSLDEVVTKYAQQKYIQGEQAFTKGHLNDATKAFKAVLSLKPADRRAVSFLSKIENAKEDSAQAHYTKGMQYFNEEHWDNALISFEAALTLHPTFSPAKEMYEKVKGAADVRKVLDQGISEFLSGHYSKAMKTFSTVIEIDPTNKEAMERQEQCLVKLNEEVEEYFNRGIQFYTAEKYQAAIAEWDKALNINNQHEGSKEYRQKAIQKLEALKNL